ncbi:MAG: aspartate-semialdehyde dehydrogenase [Candidatus Methanomethylophilaceae archaeon]|jgi:aspartate-semialdehyde dehydrogenase|nr:aspartate-semialdehyde dehydrogenase [Candidatus Methanomethylophilaceae archaeon]NLF33959.1 aspartate-semialdehyde dehydrogenase [Thermoplasmatales archaeon]
MSKINVAVLGATGMIGQRFIQMLEGHPYFEIEGLYASERSEGKRLADVMKVRDFEFSRDTMERRIETMDVSRISSAARIAFSGIPSDLAGPTETALAGKGVAVFTNAGSHRMDGNVPILIPEVNPDHIESVRDQPSYGNGGFIVTNANCSSTGIAAPLSVLDRGFGLRQVFVSTYQALSGAGYPGVPSLDAVGNVIPYIGGEEEKMEAELTKMLGTYSDGAFRYAGFKVLANCARVPVIDGHTESLVLDLEREPSLEEVSDALSGFRGEPQRLGLPSAPEQPIIVRTEKDRPQPAMDANAGAPARARGMAVTVGRLRRSNGYYKAFALSHNTLRGGAGGSVLNAELARARNLL